MGTHPIFESDFDCLTEKMSDLKQLSLEEVKKHNTASDCWTVIHNKVYDVTKFLVEHPGGEEIMLESAGMVATEGFEDVGHSSDARELLKDYLIGELVESERTEFKSQYVYTGDNKEGGPTPLFWVIGVALTAVAAYFYVNRFM